MLLRNDDDLIIDHEFYKTKLILRASRYWHASKNTNLTLFCQLSRAWQI